MTGAKILGIFFIIISVVVLSISYQGYQINNFKNNGIEVIAKIYKKYKKHSSEPWGIWTIKKTRRYSFIRITDYYFDIGFFKGENNKKSVFKFVEASFNVSKNTISEIKKGDKIKVIYLPDDPDHSIICLKDFEDDFYQMSDSKKSLYNDNGKKINATVSNVDKNSAVVSTKAMLHFVPGMGNLDLTTIPVIESVYDSFNVGDEIKVLYSKKDPKIAMAKKQLDSLIYLNPYIGVLLSIFLIGYGIYLINKS